MVPLIRLGRWVLFYSFVRTIPGDPSGVNESVSGVSCSFQTHKVIIDPRIYYNKYFITVENSN